MGGKNIIIVMDDANLDLAVDGAIWGGFGTSGQRCTAASRVAVQKKVYGEFVTKFAERAKSLRVGNGLNAATDMGPCINEQQLKTVMSYVEIGKNEGAKLAAGGHRLQDGDMARGWFHEPTIFSDCDAKMRICQEEIFGPVLAVTKAKDFDEALSMANDSEFGLTGAVYSQNPKKIERAEEEFHVGNLYMNRKCTGALVGAHPFGGFNMSGTDSKSGGQDYLLLFLQAKTVSEKVGATK